MARHKSKAALPFPVQMFFVVGIIALSLWVIQHELPLILLISAAGAGTFVAVKFVLPARRRKAILERADTIIRQHTDPLARRRAQLVRQDPYGKLIRDKWLAEIQYFIVHHIRPLLPGPQQSMFDLHRAEFVHLITVRIEELVPNRPVFETFSPSMSPSEFETFCADQLRAGGWNARVTQTSRDQGVDVIAEKSGLRVVLQCKLYSNPVGNKAVQEIVAGKVHEQAEYGAVVTNNTYTTSAQELASTNRILLLHYSDLPQLETLLRSAPPTTTRKDSFFMSPELPEATQ